MHELIPSGFSDCEFRFLSILLMNWFLHRGQKKDLPVFMLMQKEHSLILHFYVTSLWRKIQRIKNNEGVKTAQYLLHFNVLKSLIKFFFADAKIEITVWGAVLTIFLSACGSIFKRDFLMTVRRPLGIALWLASVWNIIQHIYKKKNERRVGEKKRNRLGIVLTTDHCVVLISTLDLNATAIFILICLVLILSKSALQD